VIEFISYFFFSSYALIALAYTIWCERVHKERTSGWTLVHKILFYGLVPFLYYTLVLDRLKGK